MARGNPAFGRRRTIAQVEKDAKAAGFFRQGMSYRDIAEAMGFKSKASAYNAVKRAIADITNDHFDAKEALHLMLERIQDRRRICQEIIETPHYLAAPGGKIATAVDPKTGGEFLVLDDGPKQRALAELRHLDDQEDRLLGLAAPARRQVDVVTQSTVDKQIEEELKALKELADAGGAPGPGVIREP